MIIRRRVQLTRSTNTPKSNTTSSSQPTKTNRAFEWVTRKPRPQVSPVGMPPTFPTTQGKFTIDELLDAHIRQSESRRKQPITFQQPSLSQSAPSVMKQNTAASAPSAVNRRLVTVGREALQLFVTIVAMRKEVSHYRKRNELGQFPVSEMKAMTRSLMQTVDSSWLPIHRSLKPELSTDFKTIDDSSIAHIAVALLDEDTGFLNALAVCGTFFNQLENIGLDIRQRQQLKEQNRLDVNEPYLPELLIPNYGLTPPKPNIQSVVSQAAVASDGVEITSTPSSDASQFLSQFLGLTFTGHAPRLINYAVYNLHKSYTKALAYLGSQLVKVLPYVCAARNQEELCNLSVEAFDNCVTEWETMIKEFNQEIAMRLEIRFHTTEILPTILALLFIINGWEYTVQAARSLLERYKAFSTQNVATSKLNREVMRELLNVISGLKADLKALE